MWIKTKIFSLLLFSLVLVCSAAACYSTPTVTQDMEQKTAENFVKSEPTYLFDGIPETLKVTGSTAQGNGRVYMITFDCRHSGYGDRSGQVLAEVITSHLAEVTVQSSQVTAALLDGQWDMINQRHDIEIKMAPIDEVTVNILKSNPPQISVHIKAGLPDGCTTFHDIQTVREGEIVNIKLTVQRPRERSCPAIYTTFEKDVNLGSDYAFGLTYVLNVNDYTTTFTGTNNSK
jgi:hypothetical protein